MQDVEYAFAQRLKEVRESMKLSQARLAALLAERRGIDLDPTAITRIERHQRGVGLNEAHAIADVLSVRLSDLCRPASAPESILLLTLDLADAECEHARVVEVSRETGARVREVESRVSELRNKLAKALADLDAITVSPRTYKDLRAAGEAFRSGRPVVLRLGTLSDEDYTRAGSFIKRQIRSGNYSAITRLENRAFVFYRAPVGEAQPADDVFERAFGQDADGADDGSR